MEVKSYESNVQEQTADNRLIQSEHEDGEEDEVDEIIEIIEEIEEDDENKADHIEEQYIEDKIEQDSLKIATKAYNKDSIKKNSKKDDYTTYEENKHNKLTHHVNYDVSADWEDERGEHYQRAKKQSIRTHEYNNFESHNNVTNSEVPNKDITEKSTVQTCYEHDDSRGNSFHDENGYQEAIHNLEHNSICTVSGSKSQTKTVLLTRSDTACMQMPRHRANQFTVNEPVYYTLNEEDGKYQAVQAHEEDQQQCEYITEEPVDQDIQDWEVSDANVQNQVQTEQEQIYLHEDENGQLYFKNQHGQLQPVYLTEDGNYAIAENSTDEQDSQADAMDVQEAQLDANNYVLPDLDLNHFTSIKCKANHSYDADNDDGTLTISMIISEDEHGLKRTQVIIPRLPDSKCNSCNKTFKSPLQLLKHNRLKHATEDDITTRNFPCDLCPKRFTDQNSLALHRKTHTEQRPFQCLECHKSFPTANILRKHLQLHNPDSQDLLTCIYCGRKFSNKSSLVRHEQSHLAGEKRMHICDLCQKCFSNAVDLSNHKKNHDPDKKFDCEVCGREFNRLNNLQRHMMVHQKQEITEEVLSCNVCGITYKFSSSLTRHMVTTHMNPEKLRQQAEEQRKKRETHYRRYLENRKSFENQKTRRPYRRSSGRLMDDQDNDAD